MPGFQNSIAMQAAPQRGWSNRSPRPEAVVVVNCPMAKATRFVRSVGKFRAKDRRPSLGQCGSHAPDQRHVPVFADRPLLPTASQGCAAIHLPTMCARTGGHVSCYRRLAALDARPFEAALAKQRRRSLKMADGGSDNRVHLQPACIPHGNTNTVAEIFSRKAGVHQDSAARRSAGEAPHRSPRRTGSPSQFPPERNP